MLQCYKTGTTTIHQPDLYLMAKTGKCSVTSRPELVPDCLVNQGGHAYLLLSCF